MFRKCNRHKQGIYKKTTPDLSIVKRLGGSRGAKIQQVIGITSSRRILVFSLRLFDLWYSKLYPKAHAQVLAVKKTDQPTN